MKKINGKSMVIGIKAGIISSICCTLPLILVLFGLVSIGVALSIGQFKLYFIGLSIIFLIASLIFYFRKNKTCCGASRKLFIGTAITTHILVFVLILYVFVPIIAPFIYTGSIRSAGLSTPSSVANSTELHRLTLRIDGMTCSSCAYGIQYQLEKLEGIVEARVSFSKGMGEIIYDANKISREQIINSKAFTNSYSAEIIKDESIE